MIKIKEKIISNYKFLFYDEIDFDIILKHPKDGSDGFIVCFVNNFSKSIIEYNRDIKIKNILGNIIKKSIKYEDIESKYVMIYQCNDIPKNKMLESIVNKLETTYYFTPNSID
jgi:hypothetical protein